MSTAWEEHPESFRAVAELAEAFTTLVASLTNNHVESLELQRIVTFGQSSMPGTQHTGLLLIEDGRPRIVAASSDVPERLNSLRGELGEGPALDALQTNDVVVSGEVAEDPRWPTFGARALEELNVRSIACYRLHLRHGQPAALLFVSDWPYAFDETAVAIGAIFAAYCSLVMMIEHILGEQVTNRRAVEVHREIGVAIGILLTQENVSTNEAYQRLHTAGRRLARSLPEVARHVVTHRSLPTDT
jgi:hypothetical protein